MINKKFLLLTPENRGKSLKIKFLFNFISGIYQRMFFDVSYNLTTEAIANNVLPLLIPHTINPHLSLEQYCLLLEVGNTELLQYLWVLFANIYLHI